jgi:hypothetical protein
MSKLLLNLYNVGDDEADEVRRLLDANAIAYHETRPSRWGISFGGIWVTRDEDAARAQRLMDAYQAERRERVRRELADARRDGTVPTFATFCREQPLQVLLILIGVALVLGLLALPVFLLAR